MYERLSTRLDHVIKLADKIARDSGHDYVGTEHLLLGIVRDGTGEAVRILNGLGLDDAKITKAVEKLVKDSLEDTWVMGRLPGSPHFRNTIALAIEEARRYGSREVCTEHLLLALLEEKGSAAHKVLTDLHVKSDEVRKRVQSAK